MTLPSEEIVLKEIKGFLKDKRHANFDGHVLTFDTNLFHAGILDSFGLVDLVGFIESKFEVQLSDDDINSASLASVNGMLMLIAGKRLQK